MGNNETEYTPEGDLTVSTIFWPFRDAPSKSDTVVDYINIGYDVNLCQNCDKELPQVIIERGILFCSEKCQQIAKTVRYGRSTTRDGRYESDTTVREALDIRIVMILGGGYPETARRLTPEQREAIFVRDGRVCQLCGAPATEIDHIKGSSSSPENLQAVCRVCNMAKAKASPRLATPEEQAEVYTIFDRIRAVQPTRICDDERRWDKVWRKISADQKGRRHA